MHIAVATLPAGVPSKPGAGWQRKSCRQTAQFSELTCRICSVEMRAIAVLGLVVAATAAPATPPIWAMKGHDLQHTGTAKDVPPSHHPHHANICVRQTYCNIGHSCIYSIHTLYMMHCALPQHMLRARTRGAPEAM